MLMVKYIYMKQRSTTPVSTSFATRAALVAASILMMIAAPIAIAPQAKARLSRLLLRLKQINMMNKSQLCKSRLMHTTLRQASSAKNVRPTKTNSRSLTTKKPKFKPKSISHRLRQKQQIEENQRKIEENKEALGVIIADMYVDDNITPLELLASSKNIGDYVDKQAYRESIQDTLTSLS